MNMRPKKVDTLKRADFEMANAVAQGRFCPEKNSNEK